MRLVAGAFAAILALAAGPAAALSLIRDAEIEATVRRIADPLMRAAAVSPAMVKVYVVNDSTPNAFVAGGQNIFLQHRAADRARHHRRVARRDRP